MKVNCLGNSYHTAARGEGGLLPASLRGQRGRTTLVETLAAGPSLPFNFIRS